MSVDCVEFKRSQLPLENSHYSAYSADPGARIFHMKQSSFCATPAALLAPPETRLLKRIVEAAGSDRPESAKFATTSNNVAIGTAVASSFGEARAEVAQRRTSGTRSGRGARRGTQLR